MTSRAGRRAQNEVTSGKESSFTTLAELEKRVRKLEKLVLGGAVRPPGRNAKWWLTRAGTFADDRGYDQMVRLGRKYRQSLNQNASKADR